MEANLRWVLVTGIAPIAWGSTYFVTQQFLPADSPLFGAVFRALPAGLVLLLITRKLPHGSWWWKSLVLGTLNIGAFFALVYAAAQLLPSGIASTLMATSPAVMMLLAWPLLSERPRGLSLVGAGVGFAGVFIMLVGVDAGINPLGVLVSLAAMILSSVGFILTKKWSTDTGALSLASWQLIAGGITILPVALLLEGAPPALDLNAVLGFSYVSLVATALAYGAWFAGLRHLRAGTVGLIGLLNPVTGVLLGTLVGAEQFGLQQALGIALVFVGILCGQPVAVKALARLHHASRLT